ncbi:MAG: peptidyl-prolyl cis-trans isomerase SurA [Mariniblastus sp.]|jgi:peptidyl-prolyl cis-trans isomerase SurA
MQFPPRDVAVRLFFYSFVFFWLLGSAGLDAREPATPIMCPPAPQLSTTGKEIAATVAGVVITTGQVERDLARALEGIEINPKQRKRLLQASLDKLVDQQIVIEFFQRHKIAAGPVEVSLRIEELTNELATVEKTLENYLAQTHQALPELKLQMAWQISWSRYLDRKLTDEFLESHFQQNQRRFDGTRLRVAHLLLKYPERLGVDERSRLVLEANEIWQEIETKSISFAAAVKNHSDAPTKDSGGEIGWIKIDGPMPSVFTKAAFALQVGDVSKPVTTKFGVHLIKCLECDKGKIGWQDTRDAVKQSAARAYFKAIVDRHRPEVEVEYRKPFALQTKHP